MCIESKDIGYLDKSIKAIHNELNKVSISEYVF